ncbi:MAG: hypothetical protein SYC29_17720 [Planctomycetota bacterium]|nr:hypothetical protein [Planctomycetota bacterium]
MQVNHALLSSMTSPYRPAATSATGDEVKEDAARPVVSSARPTTSTAAAAAGLSPVSPPETGTGESQPLTIDGLMEAWGTDNERYDLNRDGTVNVRDLLSLLAKLSDTTKAEEAQLGQAPGGPEGLTDEHGQSPPVPPEEDPLTVEGLKDAWGSDNERYDLNGDGTVNVRDLLALLAQMSQTPQTDDAQLAQAGAVDPKPIGPDGHTPPLPPEEEPLTIEGLKAAWGTDDPRYDLNLDGTVNVPDLLALLEQINAQQPESDSGLSPTLVTSNHDIPADDVLGEPTPLDQLLEAWGTDNPDYDLNLDGVVNVSDLLAMLAEMSGGRPESVTERSALASHASTTAASLVSRLEDAGFAEQPPSNIHELVSQLNLAATERAALLSQLADRYPDGLGLDVIG